MAVPQMGSVPSAWTGMPLPNSGVSIMMYLF